MDTDANTHEQVSAAREDAAELVERGMSQFDGGHYQEALALFQQAVAVAPGYAPAFNGIGRVYYHIGSPEEAIAAYEQAIACDPQEEDPYIGLGILLFARLGRYGDALAALARGQARHPAAAVFPDLCSTVYLRMERYEQAISSAKQAAELDPTHPSPHIHLATVYLHLRDYDNAAASCSQAEALDPSDPGTYRLHGYIEQRRGRMRCCPGPSTAVGRPWPVRLRSHRGAGPTPCPPGTDRGGGRTATSRPRARQSGY